MRRSQLHRQIKEAQASNDIIVYPNCPRLAVWVASSGIPALFCGLGAIALLILMIITPGMYSQWEAIIGLLLLFGIFFALAIWQTLLFLRMFFAKEPLLAISRAGIRIGKISGLAFKES